MPNFRWSPQAKTITDMRRRDCNLSLKLIYYALVYQYLAYGNLIWGNTFKSRIQKLVNIQKKIVRLMTFKSYFEHSEPKFHHLKIISLYKINYYLTRMFMFRYFHLKNLPELFTNYFLTNKEIHNHNTRNSSLLYTKRAIEPITQNTLSLIKVYWYRSVE
jgi:hypothetical protein